LSEKTGTFRAQWRLNARRVFFNTLIYGHNHTVPSSAIQTVCERPLGANFVFFPQHLSENGTSGL
jgi:hypothetical protein